MPAAFVSAGGSISRSSTPTARSSCASSTCGVAADRRETTCSISESAWVAVLRLARWAGTAPLRVSWSDLVRGSRREQVVNVSDELPALRQRLDDGLAVIRERIAVPDAQPGLDCGSCKHVWKCPAHPDGVNVSARRGALAPGIVSVTPTSFERWDRCRRAWRNQYLLSVAASDDSGSPDHGQRLHDVLRFVHDHGSCHDARHVNDVLDNHGGTDRLRDELERHARRCPSPCEAVGHEIELARFHREPWPPFMAHRAPRCGLGARRHARRP